MMGSMPGQHHRAELDGADYYAGQESSQYTQSMFPGLALMQLPELTLEETNEMNQGLARLATAASGGGNNDGDGDVDGGGEEARSHGEHDETSTSEVEASGPSRILENYSWGSPFYSSSPVASAASPSSHPSYTVRHPRITSLQSSPRRSLWGSLRGSHRGSLAYPDSTTTSNSNLVDHCASLSLSPSPHYSTPPSTHILAE
ncbi:hypothetical protein PG999_012077 [Apiospora kogelbergensis]|uniref:Uncharacterized protein n=1 Tax=Apiospora kogelbergensis TaxID=1337665 RepID=A0AAW0QEZ5_9PEZI